MKKNTQGTLNEQLTYWKGQKRHIEDNVTNFSEYVLENLLKKIGNKNNNIAYLKLNGKKYNVKGITMNKIVQAAIQKQGLTQASLAKQLEKPPETLNRWLKNKQQASREDIIKLADILKLPPGVVQFEPEPITLSTSRQHSRWETELLKEPTKLHLPTNFPAFFEGQIIDTINPNQANYGCIDLFDMQNKDKCIDERCINAWSIIGAVIDNAPTLLTGRLMPQHNCELFNVTGMWEFEKNNDSRNYMGIKVDWACPVVVSLEKNFIDTYTNGQQNNYSNQGYGL